MKTTVPGMKFQEFQGIGPRFNCGLGGCRGVGRQGKFYWRS